jgi:hypothetical protein
MDRFDLKQCTCSSCLTFWSIYLMRSLNFSFTSFRFFSVTSNQKQKCSFHLDFGISPAIHLLIANIFITPLPKGGGGYTVLPLSICPSFRPSKIFFVTLFSVIVDGRNLIFGHRHHIGIPYYG